MKLQAWIYVLPLPGATPEEVVARVRELKDALDPLLANQTVTGWQAVALQTPDDFDEQDVDPGLVEPVTEGMLPAVYLNLTYDLERQRPGGPDIDALIADTGLRHVLTDPPVSG